MSDITSYLFETNAIRFCEENKPFWYTSGKIGPYFINTHFLFANEKEATDFLSYVNDCLNDKNTLPQKWWKRKKETNNIYKTVIDSIKKHIEENIDVSEIDFISGGERRDWFFSNIIAYILNKPHISIFKDLSVIVNNPDFSN